MEEVFQALIDRSRSLLNLNRVTTIFGAKKRPQHRRRNRNPTRWGVVVETPTYDLTVFQVHYGKLTLKIYTKGERVLRIEVIVHNTKELHGGRSVEYFPKIVTQLKEILERFLNMLYCIDACFIGENLLENLPRPTVVGATRVGGIQHNQARMRTVIEAVVALATSPTGFSASELAAQVRERSGPPESEYGPRPAAYDIQKLRGKELVQKRGNSRRYEPLPEGLRAMVALVVLRDQVIRPFPRRQRQANTSTQTPKSNPGRSTLRKPARYHATPLRGPRTGGVADRQRILHVIPLRTHVIPLRT